MPSVRPFLWEPRPQPTGDGRTTQPSAFRTAFRFVNACPLRWSATAVFDDASARGQAYDLQHLLPSPTTRPTSEKIPFMLGWPAASAERSEPSPQPISSQTLRGN